MDEQSLELIRKRIVESKMSSTTESARKFTKYQGEEQRMIKAALASGGAFGRGKSPFQQHHSSRSRTVRDLRKNYNGLNQPHRPGDGNMGGLGLSGPAGDDGGWADEQGWFDLDPPVPVHISIHKKLKSPPPPVQVQVPPSASSPLTVSTTASRPPTPPSLSLSKPPISPTTSFSKPNQASFQVTKPLSKPTQVVPVPTNKPPEETKTDSSNTSTLAQQQRNQVEIKRLQALRETINNSRQERRRRRVPPLAKPLSSSSSSPTLSDTSDSMDKSVEDPPTTTEKVIVNNDAVDVSIDVDEDETSSIDRSGFQEEKKEEATTPPRWDHEAEYETLKAAWLRQDQERRVALKKALIEQETKTNEDTHDFVDVDNEDVKHGGRGKKCSNNNDTSFETFATFTTTGTGFTRRTQYYEDGERKTMEWSSLFDSSSWYNICANNNGEGFVPLISCQNPGSSNCNNNYEKSDAVSAVVGAINGRFGSSQPQPNQYYDDGVPASSSLPVPSPPSSPSQTRTTQTVQSPPPPTRRSICFERNGKTKRSLTFVVNASDETTIGSKINHWIAQDDKLRTDVWYVGTKRSKWLKEGKLVLRYDNPHTGNFVANMFYDLKISDICILDSSQPIKFNIEYQKARTKQTNPDEYSDEEESNMGGGGELDFVNI